MTCMEFLTVHCADPCNDVIVLSRPVRLFVLPARGTYYVTLRITRAIQSTYSFARLLSYSSAAEGATSLNCYIVAAVKSSVVEKVLFTHNDRHS